MATHLPPYIGAHVLVCLRSLARGPAGSGDLTTLLPMTVTCIHDDGRVDGVAVSADPGSVGRRTPDHIIRGVPWGDGMGMWKWRPEAAGVIDDTGVTADIIVNAATPALEVLIDARVADAVATATTGLTAEMIVEAAMPVLEALIDARVAEAVATATVALAAPPSDDKGGAAPAKD